MASHDTRRYAHIGVERDGYSIAFDFDAELVERLKALGIGARWSPDRRLWTFPAWGFRDVRYLLERLGYEHNITARSQPATSARGGGSWATEMFDAIPDHLCEPVFRALVKVLHPDVGGDTRAAQILNDAYRRLAA